MLDTGMPSQMGKMKIHINWQMKAKRLSKKKVSEEKNCKSPSVGFEPAMPGLKVQCYNHHSVSAIVKNKASVLPIYVHCPIFSRACFQNLPSKMKNELQI